TPRIVSNQVPTDISLFDVMISEFNNMSSSPYSSYFSLSKDDEHCLTNDENDKEIIKVMETLENKTLIIEDTETVNISKDPTIKREVKIGLTLSKDERTDLINLVKEFIDVFAWSYEDMPGINREIAQHTIPLISGMKPVKQKLRRMKPDVALKIKEEVRSCRFHQSIQVSGMDS